MERYKPKTYVITAAQGVQNPSSARKYGRDSSKGRPHTPLIKNMENYVSDKKNASLEICAVSGSYVNEIEMHSILRERGDVRMNKAVFARLEAQRKKENNQRLRENPPDPHYFFERVIPSNIYRDIPEKINSKFHLVSNPTPSQNQDPLTGNLDLAQVYIGTSVVFPHPKQRLKPAPKNLSGKLPRIVMTTGACTLANYNTTNSLGARAARQHQYGFVVVDVLSDRIYLPRIVPAQKDGSFVDMKRRYTLGEEAKEIKTEVLVLGDLHCPMQDPVTMIANLEMIDFFNPKQIVIHDLFDGKSISHHTWNDDIERMLLAEEGNADLENELENCLYTLGDIASRAKGNEVVIVASNHDVFLNRWLSEGRYRRDGKNVRIAHKILGKIERGDWPLEVALKQIGNIPKNVRFISLSEDNRRWGYETGAHGHLGLNGSRGSLKSLRAGFGKVIMGHTHALEVDQGSISVGTSSIIPMDYQLGQPSTSMPGNAVIYEGGFFAQALPIIGGRWKKE